MKSSSDPAFTVVDKRGAAHVEAPVIVAPQAEENPDRSFWKSTDLLVVLNQIEGQIMVLGRAIGLRSDDCLFCADWVFPPRWHTGIDWPKEARKRLDTFLNCDCTNNGPCVEHQFNIPQWMRADGERLNLLGREPLSEVMEVMQKVEMARRPTIVPAKGLIK